MPNKHFYFAMGAMTGTLFSWLLRKYRFRMLKSIKWMKSLYKWDRHWFLYFPILILIFGVIAWIPDIFHALGFVTKEVSRGPIFNIFFFHSYFEIIEDQNLELDQILNWIGEVTLFTISIGILLFYARLIQKIRKNKVNRN